MNEAISVTALNEYIKARLDQDVHLQHVSVRGEISNFTNHYKSGHFYFTLKDEGGVLRAVMFKYSAQKIAFTPENGMKVIATGRVSSFVRDGQYQLYCDSMEPDGIGALYLAFEQLKRRLDAEGLFDPAAKQPLPKCPLKVGVITSPTGAAVRDIINVASRRFPLAKLILNPVLVQGEGAAAQLSAAVRFFNERYPVDVILIGRGGGSLEELWAFNDETLAREIFQSRIPVVSAVGHETDFTICDFVSDVRAPTPSAAAEIALPDTADMKRKFENVRQMLSRMMLSKIDSARAKVHFYSQKPVLLSPLGFLSERRVLLDRAEEALVHAMNRTIETKKHQCATLATKLDALSPLSAFSRGYSAVLGPDKTAVTHISRLSVGDEITLKTRGGSARATVSDIQKEKEL
ncbi:MAG: exodeoxyribonuclease VII large subunit [Clostridia bacterium]|nr:exodeoxyribonuclease VII large subunit [Clostridia bacterium]